MTLKKYFNPRIISFLKLFTFMFLLMFVFRLGFYLYFKGTAHKYESLDLLKAFYIGSKFDVRTTLAFLLPFLFLSPIPFLNPTKKSFAKKFWVFFYGFIFSFLLLFYFLDIGYYAYLEGRLNATVITFAFNPKDSALMLWQSYPVIWIFVAFLICQGFVYWTLKFRVFNLKKTHKNLNRKSQILSFLIITLFVLIGLYGKASHFPLRWSEAFFSGNSFVSAVALNPIHYFIDSLKNKEKEYSLKKTKKYYDTIAKYLKIPNPDKKYLKFRRPLKLTPLFSDRPNVIVIVMESLAAYKTGLFGNPLDPTPSLDKLADQSYFFKNYYVPSEGTARSMFGLVTGIPDVGAIRTSSRNPTIVNQNTLINAFKGYEKFYFIGGDANWANIRGVVKNNVPEIQVYEEGMYQAERTDVWGLSDLQLFEEAHRILAEKKSDTPIFALIQSASFHRPYSIPEQKGAFQLHSIEEEESKKWGFHSVAEFNSLRFSDYSLGRFFELINKDPRFDNTIYAIVGDHGLPDNQAQHLSEGAKVFSLEKFHVPFIIYSKKIKDPKVLDKIATEMDVLPTLAAITNHPFDNSTLGRNLFSTAYDDSRFAFTYFHYLKPPIIGVLGADYYAKGNPFKIDGFYDYKSGQPEKDLQKVHPEEFEFYKDLTFGLYETSRYLLYHNSPK